MNDTHLTDAEIEYLDNTLLDYGNDESILMVSELDGFFAAIISGPQMIPPSIWYPVLWGGAENEPKWPNLKEKEKFFALLIRHMNFLVTTFMHYPAEFEALFMVNDSSENKTTIYIAEEWCFGYMRGVDLGQWPTLPDEMDVYLEAIRLHGREDNFDRLGKLSIEEHQQTVAKIEPAAAKLHAYWLEQRTPTVTQLRRTEPKTGRNDPCACGSGKKYKQCCLH